MAFLAELAERNFSEPAVVLPTHDAPLAAVARNAERLAAYPLPGSGWTCSSRCSASATSTRSPRPRASACR